MKRRILIRVIVFLLLGAIINVAVAWGCAIKSEQLRHDRSREYGFVVASGRPPQQIAVNPGTVRISHTPGLLSNWATSVHFITPEHCERLLPRWSRFRTIRSMEVLRDEYPGLGFFTYVEHACGWPMLSLRSRFMSVWKGDPPNTHIATEGLGSPLRLLPYKHELPLRPVWPGFAINTIFYAAVLWVLFAAPGMVKRRLRRVRGRCLHCGYDLRGQPPAPEGESIKCPECGNIVKS